MFDGMSLIGGSPEREFGRRVILRNNTTDMFTYPGGNVNDINLRGISFWGNGATKATDCIDAQNSSNGFILYYSKIEDCGFEFFTRALALRPVGCTIQDNYINNCVNTPVRIGGFDSIFKRNLVNSTGIGTLPMVLFENCVTTIASENFITHTAGGSPLKLDTCAVTSRSR
jgi:hypothetical protein